MFSQKETNIFFYMKFLCLISRKSGIFLRKSGISVKKGEFWLRKSGKFIKNNINFVENIVFFEKFHDFFWKIWRKSYIFQDEYDVFWMIVSYFIPRKSGISVQKVKSGQVKVELLWKWCKFCRKSCILWKIPCFFP